MISASANISNRTQDGYEELQHPPPWYAALMALMLQHSLPPSACSHPPHWISPTQSRVNSSHGPKQEPSSRTHPTLKVPNSSTATSWARSVKTQLDHGAWGTTLLHQPVTHLSWKCQGQTRRSSASGWWIGLRWRDFGSFSRRELEVLRDYPLSLMICEQLVPSAWILILVRWWGCLGLRRA